MAPELLGATLRVDSPEGSVTARLTEVEAYEGLADPASHAFRGPTRRTAVMFGPPGHLYVYFSYGMHWCANIVAGPPGTASAVLLRAGRVVAGIDLARSRRGLCVPEPSLAKGPACLTRALAIDRAHCGVDVVAAQAGLALSRPDGGEPGPISAGPRVGVSTATDVEWRFWRTGDETVSLYRRSPRA